MIFFQWHVSNFFVWHENVSEFVVAQTFFEGQMRNINLILLAKRNSWRAVQVEQNQDKLNYSYLSKFKWCTEYYTDNFFVLLFTFDRSWEVEKSMRISLIIFRHFTKKLEIYFLIFIGFWNYIEIFFEYPNGRNNSVVLQKKKEKSRMLVRSKKSKCHFLINLTVEKWKFQHILTSLREFQQCTAPNPPSSQLNQVNESEEFKRGT